MSEGGLTNHSRTLPQWGNVAWLLLFLLTISYFCSAHAETLTQEDMLEETNFNDALIAPDISRLSRIVRTSASSASTPISSSPGYYETSEYLIGKVAVGVILLESNGTIDIQNENWTAQRENEVIAQISSGLSWLSDQNPKANVSFVYDIHLAVPTSYEPIKRPHSDLNLSIAEAMTTLGYPSTSTDDYAWMTQVRDYVNSLRSIYHTDWAFSVFVIDSRNDPDGCFSDLIDSTRKWSAFAYLGGPLLVMTYDNDWAGIGNMGAVTAHETCHIFYATDEYNNARELSGYLGVQDNEGARCMMRDGSILSLCTNSKQQLGWRDTDADGIQDIVDTYPDSILPPYTPDPTNTPVLNISGYVSEIPYPNQNVHGTKKNVTINKISRVEFRVDGENWQLASAVDGALDQANEAFTFLTPSLSVGHHSIDVRAINSVENVEPDFSTDEVYRYNSTVYVPWDFPTIQEAINAAYAGDTVQVDSGTYYENVLVNKTLSLLGVSAEHTIIDGRSNGNVLNITATNVTVAGFTIRKSGTDSPKNHGIYISSASQNNNVTGNIIETNYFGIYLNGSSSNSMENNNITNNSQGILLVNSQNNTLRNNQLNSNSLNFGFDINGTLNDFVNDIDATNTLDGKTICYWVNKKDATVPSDAGYVALINCTGITVQNLNLTQVQQGILLAYTDNSLVLTNTFSNCSSGIDFYYSSNNTLNQNLFETNNIGVRLSNSQNNTILMNTFKENVELGIDASQFSNHNKIYRNNFQTPNPVRTMPTIENTWDDGYPYGNYWRIYSATDSFGGRHQNITGGDGIWDNPYIIDQNNTDQYPLAFPYETKSPIITLISPGNKTTATNTSVPLTVTIDEFVPWIGYSLDEQPNATVTGNTTLPDIRDGRHKIVVYANDTFGNTGTSGTLDFSVDTTAPTGSIIINNGDISAPSTTVTLSLTYWDINSVVTEVRYSNDGVWDTEPWEPPAHTKTWTLTAENGMKTVYFQVKDNAGITSVTFSDTIILNTPNPSQPSSNNGTTPPADETKPVANAGPDQTVNEDAQVTLNGSASSDNVGIASYTWTFKDETNRTLTGKTPSHIFEKPGTYTIDLNVQDAAGNAATDSTTITVLDITDPKADAGQDQHAPVGSTLNFDAIASSDNVGITSYNWDFGDGTTGIGETATHTYRSGGTYTVTLTVTDQTGNSATDTIRVQISQFDAELLWMIGITVSFIAIGAVVAVLLFRKRKLGSVRK